ncbi:MAG: hypothetical protein G01um101416_679, partial [Microgenomates group bacterium Gr01-1014_16]
MNRFIKKGFTLIELLVTIGILAIVMAAVLAAINPQDKLRQANDSKVQADVGQLATAAQAYAAGNNGFYPATIAAMVPGEIVVAPVAPTGYTAYSWVATP